MCALALGFVVALALAPSVALAQRGGAGSGDDGAAAAAERKFLEGERLFDEGKLSAACDAFHASNTLEPRAGTLIKLGQCKERLGLLASAYDAFQRALERVRDPYKKQVASERVSALHPRLSYLTILVTGRGHTAGLRITRNGERVDPARFGRAIPVDAGSYEISATAPGHTAWSLEVQVDGERDAVTVSVPALASFRDVDLGARADRPSIFTPRRKLAVAVALAGAGLLGGAAVFGSASGDREAEAAVLCAGREPCADARSANALRDRAQAYAFTANVGFVAGGTAVASAVALWLLGAPDRADSRVSVSPRAGGPGVDVQVRF